jgi:cytochrome c
MACLVPMAGDTARCCAWRATSHRAAAVQAAGQDRRNGRAPRRAGRNQHDALSRRAGVWRGHGLPGTGPVGPIEEGCRKIRPSGLIARNHRRRRCHSIGAWVEPPTAGTSHMRMPMLLLAAASLAACSTEPAPSWQSGDAESGYQVVQDLCSDCHATGPTGESRNAAAPPLRRALQNYRADWLADDLHASRPVSLRRMPIFHFGEGHEYDIVAYLLTIQEKTPPMPPAG